MWCPLIACVFVFDYACKRWTIIGSSTATSWWKRFTTWWSFPFVIRCIVWYVIQLYCWLWTQLYLLSFQMCRVVIFWLKATLFFLRVIHHFMSKYFYYGSISPARQTVCWSWVARWPCCLSLSNLSTSTWSAWPDGSGRWDNQMSAQHLPRDILRLRSGLQELAQKKKIMLSVWEKFKRQNNRNAFK